MDDVMRILHLRMSLGTVHIMSDWILSRTKDTKGRNPGDLGLEPSVAQKGGRCKNIIGVKSSLPPILLNLLDISWYCIQFVKLFKTHAVEDIAPRTMCEEQPFCMLTSRAKDFKCIGHSCQKNLLVPPESWCSLNNNACSWVARPLIYRRSAWDEFGTTCFVPMARRSRQLTWHSGDLQKSTADSSPGQKSGKKHLNDSWFRQQLMGLVETNGMTPIKVEDQNDRNAFPMSPSWLLKCVGPCVCSGSSTAATNFTATAWKREQHFPLCESCKLLKVIQKRGSILRLWNCSCESILWINVNTKKL